LYTKSIQNPYKILTQVGVFTVNFDYPDGVYLRPKLEMGGKEESPYISIPASMYWAVVTT
jgi:hypothetical protein